MGTSTSQEAKAYFQNMERHRIAFRYNGPEDDDHIVMAFSKRHVEQRKEWLTNFMVERYVFLVILYVIVSGDIPDKF